LARQERPAAPDGSPTSFNYPLGPTPVWLRKPRGVRGPAGQWEVFAPWPSRHHKRPCSMPKRTLWTPVVEPRRKRGRSECHGTPKEPMSEHRKEAQITRCSWTDTFYSRSDRRQTIRLKHSKIGLSRAIPEYIYIYIKQLPKFNYTYNLFDTNIE